MLKNMDIQPIQEAIRDRGLFFTDHAVRQMIKRAITDTEVQEAILKGEIIEEYPEDKYGSSCLIYGDTSQGRPLHVLCSAPPRVRVITTYQPHPDKWVNHRHRR